MARYQLIGRKKVIKARPAPVSYPLQHICGLPHEVLLQIFDFLDPRDLLSLSLTCSRFRGIINKTYLYRQLALTERTMSRFASAHLWSMSKGSLSKRSKSAGPSSNINYIEELSLVNPPIRDSANRTIKIASTYGVTSNLKAGSQSSYQDYVAALRCLLQDAYGLKKVSLSEISPHFEFFKDVVPAPVQKTYWKKAVPSRTLQSLTLKPQSGWSINFKWSHIALFFSYYDKLKELCLHNFIIDDLKLSKESVSNVSIEKLTIDSCSYADTFRKNNLSKKLCPLFTDVQELHLLNIAHGSDLSTIDYIKQNKLLSHLTIDISSPIFYRPIEGIDQFQFDKFNPFFQLLCSHTGGYSTIKHLELINFDLFRHISQKDISDVDSWVEPSTDTFECFLSYIGNVERLTIVVNESHHSFPRSNKSLAALSNEEWTTILEPLFSSDNGSCWLQIYDHKSNNLFSCGPDR